MRILYGVQATGNGHITRARAMLPALQQAGITVDFLFSGRERAALFDMEAFGDFRVKAGFTFITQAGRVRALSTLGAIKPITFLRDVRALDVSAYDYVVTDFEPVSAWAAQRQRKTVIGLAHQYALCHRLPGTERAYWLPAALKAFAPATHLLGIHWHHFNQSILPPLITTSAPSVIEDHGFILVYLPFEDLAAVVDWLRPIRGTRFRVYAAVKQAEDQEHIQIRPLSRTAFPQDLADCSGIITNSGFGLCSEALVLGKKILTKPLRRQIEQFSNAQILHAMQRAVVMPDFDHHVLRQWLEAPSFTPVVYPDVAAAVAAWLKSGCTDTPRGLCDRLWQQVSHP
ncbi:MAG: glycosyltransferase family protein [Neisseria sp.]|nr:glycosyltransferase family protein [Neisseria sp.]